MDKLNKKFYSFPFNSYTLQRRERTRAIHRLTHRKWPLSSTITGIREFGPQTDLLLFYHYRKTKQRSILYSLYWCRLKHTHSVDLWRLVTQEWRRVYKKSSFDKSSFLLTSDEFNEVHVPKLTLRDNSQLEDKIPGSCRRS